MNFSDNFLLKTISHILIYKDNLPNECKDFIDHNEYSLISVENCYDVN